MRLVSEMGFNSMAELENHLASFGYSDLLLRRAATGMVEDARKTWCSSNPKFEDMASFSQKIAMSNAAAVLKAVGYVEDKQTDPA